MNFFIIDLDKAASNQMCFRIVAFCYGHNLAESSGNYTLSFLCAGSHHGVCLTTTSLPIGEDGAVITI